MTVNFSRTLQQYWKHRFLMLLFIPAFLHFVIFKYVPIYGIVIAFKDYMIRQGILGSPWVGLEHLRLMFIGRSFPRVFRNTVVISLYQTLFGFPAPIIFAILLNELYQVRFKKVVQTISYLPHFLSWVVLGGIMMEVLSPSRGPLNFILIQMGFKPIFFLGDPDWFRFTLITTWIWQTVGWSSIVYLATLSGIDPQLYEAAKVDGAGRFRQIRHITLPGLAPTITIMLIFAIGKLIKDDFDQVFNLYNPAVYQVGDVIGTYVYRKGIQDFQYSFATAVGLFKNVIAFGLILGTNAVTKRINDYGLF